jgi:hypothetical protein
MSYRGILHRKSDQLYLYASLGNQSTGGVVVVSFNLSPPHYNFIVISAPGPLSQNSNVSAARKHGISFRPSTQ